MAKSFQFGLLVLLTACLTISFDCADAFGQRGRGGDDDDDRRSRWGRGGEDNERRDRGGDDRRDRGGGFDPTQFISRLDANKNGVLEPTEMRGRTGEWIKGMGFNASRPVPIASITKKVNSERASRAESQRREEFLEGMTIAGFGDVEEEQGIAILEFGTTDPELQAAMANFNFSEDDQRDAERTIRRYDRNRNGVLEKEEYERGRWGNPSPEESDTNRDGVLSLTELMYREKTRETSRGDDDDDDRRGRYDRGRYDRNRDDDRGSSRDRGSSSNRFSSSRRDSGSSSSSSSSRSSSNRMEQYVEELIDQYDKNKDGDLDKEEMEDMRRKPPESADKNEDGKLSQRELIEYYDRGYSSRGSSSSGRRTSRFGGERMTSSSAGKEYVSKEFEDRIRSAGADRTFMSKDLNKDGQIQMHEYTDDWTEELLEEFQEVDLNGDGIITPQEWDGK